MRLMGAHELRIRLGGISRQRVYQLTSRHDFPEPVPELGQGKVWLTEDIEAWIAQHDTMTRPMTLSGMTTGLRKNRGTRYAVRPTVSTRVP
jgi:prophage regulatory protein